MRGRRELELDNIIDDLGEEPARPLRAVNANAAEVRKSRLNPIAIAAKLKALISPSTARRTHPPLPAPKSAMPPPSPLRTRPAAPVAVMGAPAPKLLVARPQTAPSAVHNEDVGARAGLFSGLMGGGGGGPGRKVSARGRINVFVRVRPMTEREKGLEGFPVVDVASGCDVYVNEFCQSNDYLRQKRIKSRQFTFDVAFGPDSLQESVYQASTATLVEDVLDGRNACCFCYGATGAGKTFTMLGTEANPGVMIQALQDLFARLGDGRFAQHQVRLSYLEVYNETVRDLLNPQPKPLELRENDQGVTVNGLSFFEATSVREIMQLLQQGNTRRTTESTRCNATSSRSHAVLQVLLEAQTAEGRVTHGKLSLIDLAGSERAIATEVRTQRSVEGANINKSLLALSSCISALVEGKKHIPYRNSKLTKLLKDSLGGQCQTAMIANISPCSTSLNETSNTLHWADRAKQIRTKDGPAAVAFRPTSAAARPGTAQGGAGGACDRCAELEAALQGSESERRALARQLEDLKVKLRELQQKHVLPSCQGGNAPYQLRSDQQIREVREMLDAAERDRARLAESNKTHERELEALNKHIEDQDAIIERLKTGGGAGGDGGAGRRPPAAWVLEGATPPRSAREKQRAGLTAYAINLDDEDDDDFYPEGARTAYKSPLVARQPLAANPRGANVAGPSAATAAAAAADVPLSARRVAKRPLRSMVANENEERDLYLESPTEKRPVLSARGARLDVIGAPVAEGTRRYVTRAARA